MKKYLELNSDSDYAYMLMAKSSMAIGRYDEAETYINSAIMLRDCYEYRMEQAKILYNMKAFELAQNEFESLLQNNEDSILFNYSQ